ncbi:hypothetical protein F0562_013229 [Nyssa sinensis]|uniref:RNase H type-1 domain-containing protein n=1 Tax=Nyssa sinensis TaxID=561372 RepID=A0A5J4ZVL9_9ASTE|nr:hypothetical protein F0562_013229 [Nyssa sinensis]
MGGIYGLIGVCSSLSAELWVIRESLHAAVVRGYPKLIVESDCEVSITLLKKLDQTHPQFQVLMDDCRNYAANMVSCRFVHRCRRPTNSWLVNNQIHRATRSTIGVNCLTMVILSTKAKVKGSCIAYQLALSL